MTTTLMPLMLGGHPVPVIYPDTDNAEAVTIGAASAQSAAVDSTSDRVVRLCADVACWIAIGADPTAAADTAGSIYLPANAVEMMALPAGAKVAVIQDATGGTLSIAPARAV